MLEEHFPYPQSDFAKEHYGKGVADGRSEGLSEGVQKGLGPCLGGHGDLAARDIERPVKPLGLDRERGERALSLSALARSAAILEVSLGDLLDTGRRAPAGPKDAGFAELKKLWKGLDEDQRDLVVRLVREVGRG